MPYPKGINTPEVRARFIQERRDTLAKFDALCAEGMVGTTAARTLGYSSLSTIASMRRTLGNLTATDGPIRCRANPSIDLGLAVLSCLLKPGEALTGEDIAAWCDCSRATIDQIERRAIRKIRTRLMKAAADLEIASELRYLFSGEGAA